jgi:CubicO group peptidase (beta-lactamase class C family)
MSKKFCLAALAALLTVLPANADTMRNGFSVERLARVDAILDQYVNEGRVAGIVALVLRDGKPVYQHAVGWADKEAGRKMTMDTEFRIASQSKALTSVAILQLMEEGKLTVNDRAGKWIPTFEKTMVSTRNENGLGTSLVAAKRPITIRDLLTHTAGISYGTEPEIAAQYEAKALGPATGYGYYFSDKDEPICVTMERLGTLPFVAQPGEKYVYGYNTDILGCIVEKAAGVSLDEFFRKHITGPLGMKDTYFFLPPEQRERFAAVYGSDADGKAVRQPEGQKGQGHYVDGPRKSFSGGAGLISTARDYATFLEALRNGGALGKVRILSPHAVQLMTTNQVGKLRGETANGFGFGFETHDRYGTSGMESVGSWGWGGAYGTWYRVDPEERLTTVLMIQLLPNSTDLRDKFATSIYQALLD